MARFRLDVEYDGTRYRGWQAQANAKTVQGELKNAVADAIGRRDFELGGAGRTDAGVHALGQVAHLEAATGLGPEELLERINTRLPSDINVLAISRASPRFHARHEAKARSYLYQISRRRTAFCKRWVWWVREPLDLARLERSAALFEGMHDFRSFTADAPEEKSTLVEIREVRILEAGDLLLIRIVGSHFLWKMVRKMVGAMVEAAKGGVGLGDVERWLREESTGPDEFTAPPSGLFLEKVLYGGDRLPELGRVSLYSPVGRV